MTRWQESAQTLARGRFLPILLLTGGNLLFNILSNAGFKVSAESRSWREFLIWQILGNLAGLVTVLTFTGLLRYIPLHMAFPLTTGLAVIGVQVGAAWYLFGEAVGPRQWAGTLLVVAGILLIGGR